MQRSLNLAHRQVIPLAWRSTFLRGFQQVTTLHSKLCHSTPTPTTSSLGRRRPTSPMPTGNWCTQETTFLPSPGATYTEAWRGAGTCTTCSKTQQSTRSALRSSTSLVGIYHRIACYWPSAKHLADLAPATCLTSFKAVSPSTVPVERYEAWEAVYPSLTPGWSLDFQEACRRLGARSSCEAPSERAIRMMWLNSACAGAANFTTLPSNWTNQLRQTP